VKKSRGFLASAWRKRATFFVARPVSFGLENQQERSRILPPLIDKQLPTIKAYSEEIGKKRGFVSQSTFPNAASSS